MDRPEGAKPPGSLTVVNYHHVRAERDPDFPHLHGLTLDQFRAQLDVFERRFEFIGPDQLEDVIRGDGALPNRSCLLTFDDGLRDHYEYVLPELKRRGIRACFFVCTAPYAEGILLSVHRAHLLSGKFGYLELRGELMDAARQLGCPLPGPAVVERAPLQYRYDDPETAQVKYFLNFVLPSDKRERILQRVFQSRFGDEKCFVARHYMTATQLRALRDEGMTIGLHSHRHLALAAVPTPVMREDLRQNAAWLKRLVGRPPRWVSYPYGGPDSWSEEVMGTARGLNVLGGFTMTRQINRLPLRSMAIGRLDTNDAPGGKSAVELESLPCV
jgi:peptidoglycan/xylan/chitin deacetylase (PgdA/CDA1 family)